MKTDTSQNGELKRRQTRLIPKGHKLIQIPEIRAWIAVPTQLTQEQCEQAKASYLKRYTDALKTNLKHLTVERLMNNKHINY